MVVTFTAPCPECAQPVMWTQTLQAGAFSYNPDDVRINCRCGQADVA